MDLAPFGLPRRREAIVILGAGATRGASFVNDHSLLKPPLDADFFTQLRASEIGQRDDAQALLQFIATEFGETEPSMEAFYSQVNLHDQYVAEVRKKGRGRQRRYRWAQERFLRIIPQLFGSALGGQRCRWHDALVSGLDARDVVITFNYDGLVDESLRDIGRRSWDPHTGYGFEVLGAVDAWRDHQGTGRFPKQGLRLLKMHGSLNWNIQDEKLQLIQNPYAARERGHRLCIIPPLWRRSFDAAPFLSVWSTARFVVPSRKALLVIGYSLPIIDVYTQAMLRIDVDALDFLLIANPDKEARASVRRVLRSAVRPSTRVLELGSMADVGKLMEAYADSPDVLPDSDTVHLTLTPSG